MPDTIKIPGAGPQPKKTVYLIGGGIVVLAGIVYFRRKKAAATATTAAVTDPNAIDPATGYAYGSTQEATALAGQSAYQNPVNYGGGGGPAVSGTTINPIATNDQWTQAAVTYLVNTVGAPAGDVSSALGAYVAGQALSPSQIDYVHQAIAGVGPAPQAGANGYPPSIKTGAPASASYSITNPPPGTRYERDASANNRQGQAYQIWPDGTTYKLTNAEWDALGHPPYTEKNAYTVRTPPPQSFYKYAPNAYGKGKGQVYQVWPDGSKHALTNADYAALGKPHYTNF